MNSSYTHSVGFDPSGLNYLSRSGVSLQSKTKQSVYRRPSKAASVLDTQLLTSVRTGLRHPYRGTLVPQSLRSFRTIYQDL